MSPPQPDCCAGAGAPCTKVRPPEVCTPGFVAGCGRHHHAQHPHEVSACNKSSTKGTTEVVHRQTLARAEVESEGCMFPTVVHANAALCISHITLLQNSSCAGQEDRLCYCNMHNVSSWRLIQRCLPKQRGAYQHHHHRHCLLTQAVGHHITCAHATHQTCTRVLARETVSAVCPMTCSGPYRL